ncbi:hypothetical protein CC86DRAFT_414959 [Ophiobolus disseminans]|uniref:DUF7730 domain-containing protein n=1 Tax=Ophiobolus disseminans TaxID=1469910 RepID=A0A6A7AKT4_9PLEO|nr:hypothetical protein CC86DRAFT_414959 [Ophiobolus disseminans]
MDKISPKNRKRSAEKNMTTPKKKRKTKKQPAMDAAPPAPHVDTTTFPFLELSGEIRNMIYHYALTNLDYSIRFEATISKRDGRCILARLYRARPGPPDRDDLPGQARGSITKASHSYKQIDAFRHPQSRFAINLLETCHQINSEAASYFYGENMFVFEAVPHLYAFLVHFHYRLPLIKTLGLASPAVNKGTYRGPQYLAQMPLNTIFPALAYATNLEALYLNVSVLQMLSGRGHIAARSLFQQGFVWMHALGLSGANRLRVLDVVKLPAVVGGGNGPRWASHAGEQAEFRKELAGALAMG